MNTAKTRPPFITEGALLGDVFRYSAALVSVGWVLAASAAITAVFAPIAFRMYRKER